MQHFNAGRSHREVARTNSTMKNNTAEQPTKLILIGLTLLIMTVLVSTAIAGGPKESPTPVRARRIFNASLNRLNAGDLIADLSTPDDAGVF